MTGGLVLKKRGEMSCYFRNTFKKELLYDWGTFREKSLDPKSFFLKELFLFPQPTSLFPILRQQRTGERLTFPGWGNEGSRRRARAALGFRRRTAARPRWMRSFIITNSHSASSRFAF